MTSDEFYRKFKGANCPVYRGAKMPPFDPAKINESKFADELRYKEFSCDFYEGESTEDGKDVDHIELKWKTQDWNDDGIDGFVAEVKRCFMHIGFVGSVHLAVWLRGESPRSKRWSVHKVIDILEGGRA